jgi:hypothetical protein
MGPSLRAFVLFAVVSTAGYLVFLWRARRLLGLSALRAALRSRMGGGS